MRPKRAGRAFWPEEGYVYKTKAQRQVGVGWREVGLGGEPAQRLRRARG